MVGWLGYNSDVNATYGSFTLHVDIRTDTRVSIVIILIEGNDHSHTSCTSAHVRNTPYAQDVNVVVCILYEPPQLFSHASASSSAECSLDNSPANFVNGEKSTMWDIVCGSSQVHRSQSACHHLSAGTAMTLRSAQC